MDIGSFNIFSVLTKSLIRPNYVEPNTSTPLFTVPTGVYRIGFIIVASGGGGSQNANCAGGAGASLIVTDFPVAPGLVMVVRYFDGANWIYGLPPGGAYGVGAGNGVNGMAISFGPAGTISGASTALMMARPGQGGQNTGVSGAGGGITNATTVGGGKAGVSGAIGGDIDAQTDFLAFIGNRVIRVPGASGGSGSFRGGASPLAAPGGNGINGPGGGASLIGVGGNGVNPVSAGVMGGGGARTSNGGDGYCAVFWEGKKA